MIMDWLDQWRAAGGPQLWCTAFDRVIAAFRPAWEGRSTAWDGVELAHGAAGVAVGMYLIAAEQTIPVSDVTREQIKDLFGSGWWEQVAVWQAKLHALGHDPDDEHDPVMARWRDLRRDCSPPNPRELSDAAWEDASIRLGPMLGNAVRAVLAPRWRGVQL